MKIIINGTKQIVDVGEGSCNVNSVRISIRYNITAERYVFSY